MASQSSSSKAKPQNGNAEIPASVNFDFLRSEPSPKQDSMDIFRLPAIPNDPEIGHASFPSPDGSEDLPHSPEEEISEPAFNFESTRRLFNRENGLSLFLVIAILLTLSLTVTSRFSPEQQLMIPHLVRKSAVSTLTDFENHVPKERKRIGKANATLAHDSKDHPSSPTAVTTPQSDASSPTPTSPPSPPPPSSSEPDAKTTLTETKAPTDEKATSQPEVTPPPAVTPSTPASPSNQCDGNPQDHRHFYLRYDSPEPVRVFDCDKFPRPGHKQLSEYYYSHADGTPANFFTQQIRVGSALFLACPASRPRIVIKSAKFGRFYAVHETTGEPLAFPRGWDGDPTIFDFTEGFHERCKDKRFCCVNNVAWDFQANEAGMVSWTCERGEVIRSGAVVQHGSLEIHQSDIAVLQNLAGTARYPQPAPPPPPVPDANVTLPLIFPPISQKCTYSLHQSPHAWDNGGQANGQGGGFIHQLSSITATIGVAALSECDLNSEGFYPDFDLLHSVPLGLVVDLPELSAHLNKNSMRVNIIDKVMDTHLYPFTSVVAGLPVAWPMLQDLKNAPEPLYDVSPHKEFRTQNLPQFVLMGHMFPFWMFDDAPHIAKLRDVIVASMPFTEPFRNAAAAVMKSLNLTSGEYVTIHFRLEADTNEFAAREQQGADAWRDAMFNKIVSALNDKKVPSDARIYLSTGLNADDRYVHQFQGLFPNAVTKDILLKECHGTAAPSAEQQNADSSMCMKPSKWDRNTNPVLYALSRMPWTAQTDECGLIRGDRFENREYWAILDWMVTRESKLFVGAPQSMFSKMMNKIIQSHPKQWSNGAVTQTAVSV